MGRLVLRDFPAITDSRSGDLPNRRAHAVPEAIRTGDADWRYGFLAVKKDGSRVYGDTFRESEGTATFETPQDTAFLWLVVSGAPRKHSIHISDGDESNDEQWPYQFHLVGTSPDPSNLK